MTDHVNLVKLCVGADGVDDLVAWQAARLAETGAANPVHVTRMWPRRGDELLAGGSLYWVFRGLILARQRLVGLEERHGADGIVRCALVLDRAVIRTEAAPRRPFQGWRYLAPADAPADLRSDPASARLPPDLAATLADLGVR